ncbi:hypothetical protein FAI40_08505 [Acetobacteraceae bacterium]|nr:hypothetical protein FAI40_08505 [Acetobacteraceae bacterium]
MAKTDNTMTQKTYSIPESLLSAVQFELSCISNLLEFIPEDDEKNTGRGSACAHYLADKISEIATRLDELSISSPAESN